MLSKDDFREYLDQLERIEQEMGERYSSIIEKSDDAVIRKALESISDDERRQYKMLEELKRSLF